ncbi:unnamed protein product, partial [Discosporangium mesarthrocarpum]
MDLDPELSAVLVVTLDDAGRAATLMATLKVQGAMDIFRDFFVVVPDRDKVALGILLSSLPRVTVVADSMLFSGEGEGLGNDGMDPSWEGYAIQMAVKLHAARLMRTEFYLTLDADVLCTKWGLSLEEDLLPGGKGNFVDEGRGVHPAWWTASANLLQVELQDISSREGFGVTPAVLST